MKTKFLSVILALTMLCLLFSFNTSVFADSANTDISESLTATQTRLESSSGVTVSRNQPGIAGKSSTDKIQIIDVATGATGVTGSKGAYPRLEITHGQDLETNGKTTFQFNIYADGDVIPAFSFHWSEVLVWQANQVLCVYSKDGSGLSFDKLPALKKGEWHTFAMTYDYATNMQRVYIDGTMVSDWHSIANNATKDTVKSNYTTIRVGTYTGSKAPGTIAIDNVFAYAGEYSAASDKLVSSSGENLSVDVTSKKIVYNEDVFTNAQSLKDEISKLTGASKVEFFNTGFTEASADEITETVVLTAPGSSIYCFDIKPMFGIGTPELVTDGDKVGAKAVAFNNHTDPKTLTMVMAVRNAGGCLETVYSSPAQSFTGEKEFNIAPVDIAGGSAYVFFIENWNTLRAASRLVEKIK